MVKEDFDKLRNITTIAFGLAVSLDIDELRLLMENLKQKLVYKSSRYNV